VYVAIAASIGDPMYRPILSGYVGLMLIGAFYCAVGMLASSLTRNQVVSAALGFVILLVLYLGKVAGAQISGPAAQFLEYISPQTHLEDFTTGVFNTRDLVYYVSGIVLILFLTIRVVEMRKWR
jgi:ABC-2 type transport system permease protein